MKRIALVEDNADNRLLVQALLKGRYEVSEHPSGGEALAAFEERAPDLVLLDISLPGMDGTEVLTRLRAEPRWRDIPVIALTAHAMRGDRERLLELGFDAYLAKPILEPRELVAAIERLLG